MPSLQVSVPGQEVTSTMVSATAPAMSISASAVYRSRRSSRRTQRNTMFCSTVVRMVSPTKRRATSDSRRDCAAEMSPRGSGTVTTA